MSEAWQNKMPSKVQVTKEIRDICQQIIQGGANQLLQDAAEEAIDGYRSGQGVDRAVAAVLADHVASRGRQDRWGR